MSLSEFADTQFLCKDIIAPFGVDGTKTLRLIFCIRDKYDFAKV